MIINFFVTMYFLVGSGAILDLKDNPNPVFSELSHFSAFRFASEQFLRQIMESNDKPNIDSYMDTLTYHFKMQAFPMITNLSIMFFCVAWISIVLQARPKKIKE